MMDAKDIAELDRLLNRVLSVGPSGATGAGKAATELRANIGGFAEALPNSAKGDIDGAFERSVALASALAVLNADAEAVNATDERLGRAINLLLASECRRLRGALAKAELDNAQWREQAIAAVGKAAESVAPSEDTPDDDPPWDPHRPRQQRQQLDQIADLISAFKGSVQWRIGHGVVALAERLLRRQSRPTALDNAETLARSDTQ